MKASLDYLYGYEVSSVRRVGDAVRITFNNDATVETEGIEVPSGIVGTALAHAISSVEEVDGVEKVTRTLVFGRSRPGQADFEETMRVAIDADKLVVTDPRFPVPDESDDVVEEYAPIEPVTDAEATEGADQAPDTPEAERG